MAPLDPCRRYWRREHLPGAEETTRPAETDRDNDRRRRTETTTGGDKVRRISNPPDNKRTSQGRAGLAASCEEARELPDAASCDR